MQRVLLLLVEMGFLQCHEESVSVPTHGRMPCSGKTYRSWTKHTGAQSLCLIHGQVVQLHPAVEDVQPRLLQAQKKGQGSEILCHPFNPCQSLVQFSLCPWLCSSQHCAAIPRPVLGPTWPLGLYLETQLEPMLGPQQLLGPHGCYRERTLECMNKQADACS